MSAVQKIAEDYIRLWNETGAAARAGILQAAWTGDASYVDPLARVSGHEAISALVGGVQQRFPGFRFKLRGKPDGHGDYLRFSWSLGPDGIEAPIEGSDVLVTRDGRIAQVIGFLDKLPQA
ncbi:MAG TPA: nuclear transport factor 2 family protein [Candidatus Sulfotelmatobacter sp.]|nr:nuclear transport factor 2 family protein [Candidatus Sulfotelmatobacter sp.]